MASDKKIIAFFLFICKKNYPLQNGKFIPMKIIPCKIFNSYIDKYSTANLLICCGRVPILVWCMARALSVGPREERGGGQTTYSAFTGNKIMGNKYPCFKQLFWKYVEEICISKFWCKEKYLNIFVIASKLFQGNFNKIDIFTSHFWSESLGFVYHK